MSVIVNRIRLHLRPALRADLSLEGRGVGVVMSVIVNRIRLHLRPALRADLSLRGEGTTLTRPCGPTSPLKGEGLE